MNLGSVAALSNINKEIVEKYRYDAFGKPTILSPSNEPRVTSIVGNAYMFTGREYDYESGNYYYRARYYKPSIGRFLQPDPIGYYDSLNLYTYVGNNPFNWNDPFGLFIPGLFYPPILFEQPIIIPRPMLPITNPARLLPPGRIPITDPGRLLPPGRIPITDPGRLLGPGRPTPNPYPHIHHPEPDFHYEPGEGGDREGRRDKRRCRPGEVEA